MSELAAGSLAGRRFLLGISGSIAAYKAPTIFRQLTQAGATVKVILTPSAEKFIGKAVFTGLGGEVHQSMWDEAGEAHVQLATWADTFLIAPATADVLSCLAQGRSDDLLTATALCFRGNLLVAPAMHPSMWSHPATGQNVASLVERDVRLLGPVDGPVASGATGRGRMMEPEEVCSLISRVQTAESTALKGRHLVVTAGPTREALDPVRALTNLSSGKMGYALAAAAQSRGARVTLISGPVSLKTPAGVENISIETAQELEVALKQALGENLDNADALIMAAAVCDYRPTRPSGTKMKRNGEALTLELTPNPDLLAEVGKRRHGLRPVLVGFALETVSGDELIALGRRKLIRKQVDMIVANEATASLGKDESQVKLVSARDCQQLEMMGKGQIAGRILNWVKGRLDEPAQTDITH